MLDCYILNLDRSVDRWSSVSGFFSGLELNVIRVQAVDGVELQFPHADFSERGYYFVNRRKPQFGAIGCFLSHVKAMRMFLESGAEAAVICEDGVVPSENLADVLDNVMRYSKYWDIVRLAGSAQKAYIPFADLGGGYKLVSDLRSCSCSASYVINRRGAELVLRKFVPMFVHIDNALFWEFTIGLREATVCPFPLSLSELAKVSEIANINKQDIKQPNRSYPLFHLASFRIFWRIPYRIYSRGGRHVYRFFVAVWRWLFFSRFC